MTDTCTVCHEPLTASGIDGMHVPCAQVAAVQDLTAAVLHLAQQASHRDDLGEPIRALTEATHALTTNADTGADSETAGAAEPNAADEVAEADAVAEPAQPDPPAATEVSADLAGDKSATAPSEENGDGAAAQNAAELDPEHVEPPARSTRRQVAGFRAAAVVGPGWIQIGENRWNWEDTKLGGVASALDVIAIAQALEHTASPRQVWILDEVCQQLGLVAYPEDDYATPTDRARSVQRQLAQLGAPFLRPALEKGWQCSRNELGPWTLLSSGEDGGQAQLVRLVLEPYLWAHDEGDTGMVGHAAETGSTMLSLEPTTRADQIVERLRWTYDHLGVLPDSNASRTLQQVFSGIRRGKARQERRGTASVDRAGRKRLARADQAGVRPAMDHTGGAHSFAEAELSWHRPGGISEIELAQATEVLGLDQRHSYPRTAGMAVLGTGEPSWVEADEAYEAARRASAGEDVFGVWRCANAAKWDDPRIFPPHHTLDPRHPAEVSWLTTATLRTCLADEADYGGGRRLDTLGVTGAWIWPQAGKLLSAWYDKYRVAWNTAQSEEDWELRTWASDMIKDGGLRFLGKFNYLPQGTKDPQDLNRPWLYQPMWWDALVGAAKARLFWQVMRIGHQHEVWPVEVHRDAVLYLCDAATSQALRGLDTGKLGVLRGEKRRVLTDTDRARMRQRPQESLRSLLTLDSIKE